MSVTQVGRVFLILGPMFAGKTTEMHARISKAILAGKDIQVIVPTIDTRFTREAMSTSHDGIGMDAIKTDKLLVLPPFPSGTVIGIEEGHFFPDLREFCCREQKQGNDIYVAALHAKADLTPWDSISAVVPLAHTIIMKHAICVLCGQEASCSKRFIENGTNLTQDVGGAEKYVATCETCHSRNMGTRVLKRFKDSLEKMKQKRKDLKL